MAGAISSDNADDFVFLSESAIMIIPLLVKLLHLIWKQKDIIELLHRNCVYSTKDLIKAIQSHQDLKEYY